MTTMTRTPAERRPPGRRGLPFTLPGVEGAPVPAPSNRRQRAPVEQEAPLPELDGLDDGYVAVVSHELKAPLASIRGFLNLVLAGETGELNDEQRHFLSIVDRNSDRLLRLVDDLLLVTQLDAGVLGLELEPVDLGSVASEAVEAAAVDARARGVELALVTEERMLVLGDRVRLAQVVDNLLSNALKFTPAGGTVELWVAGEGDQALLAIADSGIGMSRSEQERVFSRFFRASSAVREGIPGTGLGLAIAKTFVEAHGGEISVESAEGAGTTFQLRFPLLAADQAAA